MSDLGKAYVQIVPSAKGISGSIENVLSGESQSAGKSAGLNIAGAIKGAIAAAGIGTAIKAALEAGGDLQQSFGGLETLYGEAAEGAKKYAAEAAKAGISANDYAEQAVSFGASLKQAFGGDTAQAVEAANTAIMDMTDNAAKMGTPIENIQNAYQGFAKQNYTMLDNLKLGYGGTKSEMERLLSDAQKLTGVKYDISNLGDVYSAIHVIQEDLGLTGVAAEEASSTFTGSLGAMKAAGQNLLANLSLGEDIGPSLDALGTTVQAFLFNNLFPMIGNILQQLPELLSGIGSLLIQSLNMVSNNAGEIAQIAVDLVTNLVKAIIDVAPYLVEAAVKLVLALGEALINADWIAIGTDLVNSIKDSLSLASGEILGSDGSIIEGVLNGITTKLPEVLNSGVEIITNVANGILENIPQLITTAANICTQFTVFLMQNFPTILQAGANLLLNLVNGIVSNLPQIVSSALQAMTSFLVTITANLPTILAQGITIIGKLTAGLIQAIPTIVAAIPQIIQAIVNTFGSYDWPTIGINIIKAVAQGLTNAVNYVLSAIADVGRQMIESFTSIDWKSIGVNIIQGIANGISDALDIIKDAAKGAAESAYHAAAEFLGIESPTKKGIYLGEMLGAGFAIGIEDSQKMVGDAISDLSESATANLMTSGSYELSSSTSTDDKMDVLLQMLGAYLPQIAEKEGIDVQKLYNGFNRQL